MKIEAFFYFSNKKMNVHRTAETSLRYLLRNPVNLNILKMVDILFLDLAFLVNPAGLLSRKAYFKLHFASSRGFDKIRPLKA